MVNSRVEEVDRSCDSDVDSSEEDGNTEKYTLAVWPASDCPTYLLLSSRQNKVMISLHLCGVACLLPLSVLLSRVSTLMRDIDIAILSVCVSVHPSVCLSVTFRYQMKWLNILS